MRTIRNLKTCIPFIFLALCACIFFWQTICFGKLPVPTDTLNGMYHPWRDYFAESYERGLPFKNSLITDPVRQQIPWKKLVIEKEKEWKLPLWNAFEFSGTPLIANIQAGVFYPLNLLYFIFPFITSWTLGIFIQPLLSGLFLYLYLRYHGYRKLSSLFGSVLWSYSGFAIAWLTWGTMVHVMAWAPIALLGVDFIFDKKRNTMLGLLFFSFSLIFSFFAGHSQLFFYTAVVTFFYILWKFIEEKRAIRYSGRIIGYLLGGIALAAILSSIQWIPFVRFLSTTSRIQSGSSFLNPGFFIPWQNLIQFVIPDFFGNPATGNYWGIWNYGEFIGYIGIAGLVFGISGIFSVRKNPFVIFWVTVLGLSLLFATPNPIAYLPYQLRVPFLSSLQPTRLMALIDLSLAILGAIGFDAFLGKSEKKKLYIAAGMVGCVLFGAWVFAYTVKGIDPVNTMTIKRNLLFPSLIFFAFGIFYAASAVFSSRKMSKVIIVFCIVLLAIVDLFRFGWKYTPFTDRSLFFPTTRTLTYLKNQPGPYRVISTDDRILPPNTNDWYGIESVSGYDPLYDSRYETFMAALQRGKPDIAPPYGFNRIITPTNIHSRMFPLLFSPYVLSFDEITEGAFEKIHTEGTTKIYSYKDALPRLLLVEGVEYITDAQSIFDRFYSPDFDPKTTAIVEREVPVEHSPITPLGGESVVISSYAGDRTEASVSVNTPRFLLVGNRYDPGWHVMIDQTKSEIIQANYLYFGFVVPAGSHTVTVSYE